MKGLIVKDLLLLKNQGKTLLLLLACGAVMSMSFEPQTVIVYLTMIGGMVAMGTLSYDEMDKGYSYLLTLPVTRKMYVREKYLLCVLWTACCAVIGTAVCTVITLASGQKPDTADLCLYGLGALLGICLVIALMIPFQLKFGSEKGRIVLYAFIVLCAVAFILMQRLSGAKLPEWVADVNPQAALGVSAAAACLLVVLSEQIAERIMMKKEF